MSRARWPALLLLWAVAVGAGMGALMRYSGTPGAAGAPPEMWPAGSALRTVVGKATLVLFAHPHCPCTRASLSELARLMVRARTPVTAYVLFVGTDGPLPDPRIPGVTVLRDARGEEAARLRARTSGQTLLYDGRGRLVFSGGLTRARGHEGDSAGRAAIAAFLEGRGTARAATAVFGCSLWEDE